MPPSRLYCLDVQALTTDPEPTVEPTRWLPTLCLVDLNASLLARIHAMRDLLDQHHLNSVSQRITEAAWFYPRNGLYHPAPNTLLHVAETSIWFSGWVPPLTSPCFRSSAMPLKEALAPTEPAIALDLTGIRTAETGGLLRELALLDEEEKCTYERRDALETLHDQLAAVETKTAERSSTDLIGYACALSAEVTQLQHHLEKLALETQTLTKQLLHRALGLRLGDWVINLDSRGRRVQLCVQNVEYYDRQLLLSGPCITQRCQVGKRTETLTIPVATE
ncbi:MAG: hypothetical protein GYB21_07445 [Oceanospirillales bacterium]|nr:hypothetical protein [Oceanospirillales bacterium]